MPETLKAKMMQFDIPIQIEEDTIESLIVSALEGGSNYWYMVTGLCDPNEKRQKSKFTYLSDYVMKGQGLFINDSVYETDKSKQRYGVLDLNTIRTGMVVIAQKYPHHFKDILSGDCDATTGDVFLQCCVFGELIYG
jgi:hypothetical protein